MYILYVTVCILYSFTAESFFLQQMLDQIGIRWNTLTASNPHQNSGPQGSPRHCGAASLGDGDRAVGGNVHPVPLDTSCGKSVFL